MPHRVAGPGRSAACWTQDAAETDSPNALRESWITKYSVIAWRAITAALP
jgi:hypothetical protein